MIPLRIPVDHGHLEAALREPVGPLRGAAVVCHPHPLFGGTMHTKAVYRAAQALTEVGVATLRFNFRGVGASTGSYDGGIGERDDARDALDWMQQRFPGVPLVLGGFSFGSMVALSVGVAEQRVKSLLALGLPVEMDYDFSFLAGTAKPTLVVQGENDEFGSGERVAEALSPLGEHITLVRIPGANHYFHERYDELRAAVRTYYATGPGAAVLLNAPRPPEAAGAGDPRRGPAGGGLAGGAGRPPA